MVAVSGSPGKIQVLLRHRIDLLPADAIPRFVYHQASEQPIAKAKELVERATKVAADAAVGAIEQMLQDIRSRGATVKACGMLSGSTSVPNDLGTVLRSHPLIHAAEGKLFQDAIVSACKHCGLRMVLATEREVWSGAAKALDITETGLHKEVDDLRKTVGAPWGADQKSASAVALLALRRA